MLCNRVEYTCNCNSVTIRRIGRAQKSCSFQPETEMSSVRTTFISFSGNLLEHKGVGYASVILGRMLCIHLIHFKYQWIEWTIAKTMIVIYLYKNILIKGNTIIRDRWRWSWWCDGCSGAGSASKRLLQRSSLKALALTVIVDGKGRLHSPHMLLGCCCYYFLSTKWTLNKTWWEDGEWAKKDSIKYCYRSR